MAAAADIQLSDQQIADLFTPYANAPKIALAVSGGADSVALMLLAARWRTMCCNKQKPDIVVMSVDHGLRDGADSEVRMVAGWARRFGFDHIALRWEGERPSANIQAKARAARYQLMAEACHANGISTLMTAHHLEDQAETFLLRLARGSGVDGLSAMAAETFMMGLCLARPLLFVHRAALVATLEDAGHPHIDDPSNDDQRFARVRMRALMAQMAQEGLGARVLAETAQRLARARTVLEVAADTLGARCVQLSPAGYCLLDAKLLATARDETALRLLSRVICAVGGQVYAPRMERLERLRCSLAAGDRKAHTLGGCRFAQRGEHIEVWREEGRKGLPELRLEPGQTALWDGRFKVHVADRTKRPVLVRALGAQGWRQCIASAKAPARAAIGRTFVSFWQEGALEFAPHAPPFGRQAHVGAPFSAQFAGTIEHKAVNVAP